MSSNIQETPGEGQSVLDLGGGRTLMLLETLGAGSAAHVFRGILRGKHHVAHSVAVKLFSTVASDEADRVLSALVRSARRLACIDHPNVVRVYECGLWQGRPFLVTELVSGVSLAALHRMYASKRRRMPLDLALFVASEVADGLAGARVARDLDGVQLSMVHQSLSARDVLLSWRGEVKVSDFESSTARPATSSVRSLRGVAQRAATMAPEVAQGNDPDARSDVFSFGILLRELLVGPRFPAPVSDADAIALARDGYVQPMTFQPHLPPGLDTMIARAIEVDPEARYPNASAMAFELKRIVLAMGVGDGRYFLRKALEQEWSQQFEEITTQRPFPMSEAPGPRVYELPRPTSRQKRRK
jgi:serine/threonine-protein kinase